MPNSPPPVIGIIGGSGLYQIDGLTDIEWRRVSSPFGAPSDNYVIGELEGHEVAFLARHGRGHRLSPSELNFRANIYGMKTLGVERIISVSAVGSLREDLPPLEFLIPDQFFDRTHRRIATFFSGGIVAHIGFDKPTCAKLSSHLADACAFDPPVSGRLQQDDASELVLHRQRRRALAFAARPSCRAHRRSPGPAPQIA